VPVVSASELLRQSTAAEAASAGEPATVIHRTINVEEWRVTEPQRVGVPTRSESELVARQRVETWQSASRGLKLHRLYDEQNRLVGGEWTKQDGTSMIYHHGEKPQPRTAPEVAVQAIIENGELWRLDVSAATFNLLAEHAEEIRVDERSNAY